MQSWLARKHQAIKARGHHSCLNHIYPSFSCLRHSCQSQSCPNRSCSRHSCPSHPCTEPFMSEGHAPANHAPPFMHRCSCPPAGHAPRRHTCHAIPAAAIRVMPPPSCMPYRAIPAHRYSCPSHSRPVSKA
ncbi:hypothetical protein CEXT_367021 [Caerostris extrusa]|uniref:Uncharacterized protein n=1 Tax=Caerostris extrusa TaxID=172846 RepID=A0AAV4NLL9_CAEEX|nr:hypothetical protein CEXT_367021 [Caerostris extrusa]